MVDLEIQFARDILNRTTWLRKKIVLAGLKLLLRHEEGANDEKPVVTIHKYLPGELYTSIDITFTIEHAKRILREFK